MHGRIVFQIDGVGVVDDVRPQSDQLAADVAVENQLGVIFGVDDRDRCRGQIHQIFRPADLVQRAVVGQIAFQRHGIGGMAAAVQRQNRLIDRGVDGAGEMNGF